MDCVAESGTEMVGGHTNESGTKTVEGKRKSDSIAASDAEARGSKTMGRPPHPIRHVHVATCPTRTRTWPATVA